MKAPSWGKAMGIVMICLGALSIIMQFYKISLRGFARIQSNVMDGFGDIPIGDKPNPFGSIMKNMFYMSETQGNIIMIIGFLGVGLAIFYLIGGVKLLQAKKKNYIMARNSVIVFLAYNLISVVWLSMNSESFYLSAMLTYTGIGVAFDITVLIILLSSDKSAYGIGEPTVSVENESVDDFDVL